MLRGFAAAGADIIKMLLLEGNAAGGHAGLFFHVQLALEIAAPHGLDEAALLLLKLPRFVERVRGVAVLVEILLRLGVKTVMHRVQKLRNAGGKLIKKGTPLDVLNSDEFARAFHMGGGAE